MKNLIVHHPSPDVRSAALGLIDALCMWERSSGRHHVLIVKDSIGCEYRVLDSVPALGGLGGLSDAHLLEAFDNLAASERGCVGNLKSCFPNDQT